MEKSKTQSSISLSQSYAEESRVRVHRSADPIAIIGIGCRFPGGATGPNEFWQLLCNGVDAIREVPPDRWNVRSFYDPQPGTPGKTYARWGGFIDGIDKFDAGFFGISPREAAHMDPQQRLLLEVAYEAIEDGGQLLDQLSGSNMGVFIGISTNDYAQIQSATDDRDSIGLHTTTGSVVSLAANRISYCFNLKGPSLAVDTACSSSLVAVHLACQSLQSRESTMALVGGVNVMINPEPFIGFCSLSMLSPDGRCKAFDANGNGFVRGEGAGIVLLKPLARALADGDDIYAVIRGTAVNQDGRTNGITVPDQTAQGAMLRDAYQQAGIPPEKIQYVEAHGTGTVVGDPIEVNALGAVLSPNRPEGSNCVIGSVKTNIGHLEAGAGIAGLIKVALSIKHGMIPPNLHFNNPNPLIDFKKLKLRVPRSLEHWPSDREPLYAGVNSFGFGGTNAHVLLSDAPETNAVPLQSGTEESRRPQLLILSARSEEALQSLAEEYEKYVKGTSNGAVTTLQDLAYNLCLRRTHHSHRLSLIAYSEEELVEQLNAFSHGERRRGMTSRHVTTGNSPKLAFVFSGQGPQWWAMGRELLEEEPAFKAAIETCDEIHRKHASWSLLEELTADQDHSRLHETSIAQPSIFALQVALAAVWRSWGIEPEATVGHSVGEVAAAYIAGVLTLEDAIKIIYHRGRCMDLASSKGKMLSAALTHQEAERLIAGHEDRVSIAAVNSPSSVTLSGDADTLDELRQQIEQQNIFCSFLRVNYAFHSPQMDPVHDELVASLVGVQTGKAKKPLYSTVTGQRAQGQEYNSDYWWQNVRHPVRFAQAISGLIDDGYNIFLELSPHPVLASSVTECLQAKQQEGVVLPSLRRKEGEQFQMLSSLGALYTTGHPIPWKKLPADGSRKIKLPRYSWQHESYWHESEENRRTRLGLSAHPLLGRKSKLSDPSWTLELNREGFQYLQDHKVQGHTVFPAAAYIEMALAAARETFGEGTFIVEDVDFQKALFLPDNGKPPLLQTTVYTDDSSFHISSSAGENQWMLHATGRIRSEQNGEKPETVAHKNLEADSADSISKEFCYRTFMERGLWFGPSFQGIEEIQRGDRQAIGRVQLPKHLENETKNYLIHPALLDASMQVLSGAMDANVFSSSGRVFLPVSIAKVRYFGRVDSKVWSFARLVKMNAREIEGDILIYDEDGHVLVSMQGLKAQAIDMGRDGASENIDNWTYETRWQLNARPQTRAAIREVDFLPTADHIKERLQAEANRVGKQLGWAGQYKQIEADLNRLCSIYILRAFRDLGWKIVKGEQLTFQSLIEKLDVIPQHHRLFKRYVQLLAEDGVLKETDDILEVLSTPKITDIGNLWQSLLYRFPAFFAELSLIDRCGSRLNEVLQGKTDPLQLIFPEGSSLTAEHLYQDAHSFRIYNLLVAEAITAVLERLPQGRTIRMLEIGAGTAGMTSHVLQRLPPDRTEYLFTDISRLFLQKAEQRFRDHPFIKYQMLDIEKDPAEQDFSLHSFDIVLASDVLHATSDLRETLKNVQKLLAANGLLVLLETDSSGKWVDLVFGLTEGWWRFTDLTLRPSYPLLDRSAWLRLLEESGFSNPIAVSDTDGKNGASQAVFVARAPSLSEHHVDTPSDKSSAHNLENSVHWLILADQGGTGHKIAEFLRAKGDTITFVSAGEEYAQIEGGHFQINPDRKEDFRRLIKEELMHAPSNTHGVVHCWSLDTPAADNTTAESLERTTELGCLSIMNLIQTLSSLPEVDSPGLWLITRGAQPVGGDRYSVSFAQAPLCGLGRVIMNEHQNLRCKMIDLSEEITPEEIQSLFYELGYDDEEEVALRGEARYVPRLTRVALSKFSDDDKHVVDVRSVPVRLETTAPGVLDNLTLRQIERRKPASGEVEIQVAAVAMNFRDVMKALGIYPTENELDSLLGDECAGTIVTVGEGVKDFKVDDEVIAISPGSFGSFVTTKAAFVIPKPAHISCIEAATIPIAFLTAYYALHYLGRMGKGERVLIQAATGGVGLAALQIAQQIGAEIFASAGSPEKRAFLRSLGIQHVLDSRSLSFADDIKAITEGKGVDLVLNSLAGEAINKGLASLAPYGRFLEIGKRDIYQNRKLGLRTFKNNLSFFAIDLSQLMADRPLLISNLLKELMQLFKKKRLHPLPYRVFPINDAESAFRHMAQAKHMGKIVTSIQGKATVEPVVDHVISFSPDSTYLITGGLGGFGLAVAEWMVQNGARHLVLMSRSGSTTEEAAHRILLMESKGALTVVVRADVTREEDVDRVLRDITDCLPRLRGIIHAAMVLDDALLLHLDKDRFMKVMEPKVLGTWNLHNCTAKMPLDFFVLFSSVTTMAGNPGQANYVAANAFLDAMAHYRRGLNLPALTVNWGHIADVGYVARNANVGEHLNNIGLRGFSSRQATEILGNLMLRRKTQVGVMNVDWSLWSKYASSKAAARLSRLIIPDALGHQTGNEGRRVRDLVLASQPHQRHQIVESYLKDQVARVLGMSASGIDSDRPLNEMGLDSLMTVELKNRLEKELGSSIPTVELMRGPSIKKLSNVLIVQLTGSPAPVVSHEKEIITETTEEIGSETAEELLHKVDHLSDREVDSLLRDLTEHDDLDKIANDKTR